MFSIIFFTVVMLSIFAYVYLFYRYSSLKEYFFCNLPLNEKKYVDYLGHRYVFFITEIPWAKKEENFQTNRNEVIRRFDPERAEKLLKIERNLAKLEWLSLLLLFIYSRTYDL